MKSDSYKISAGDIIKLGSSVFLTQPPAVTVFKPQENVQPVIKSAEKQPFIGSIKNATNGATDSGSACKICYATEANGAFIPCGHNFTCYNCAKKCDECPMCRRIVMDVIKIYKS